MNMKTKLLTLILLFVSQTIFAQKIGPFLSFYKQANKYENKVSNKRTAKLVKQIRSSSGNSIIEYYAIVCNYDKKNPYYIFADSSYNAIIKVTPLKYIEISNSTHDITVLNKTDDNQDYDVQRGSLESNLYTLSYYQAPIPKMTPYQINMIDKKTDTVIRKTPCFVYNSTKNSKTIQDNKEIKIKETQTFYTNKKTLEIDSIILIITYDTGYKLICKEYVTNLPNFDYDLFEKNLNFNNPKYAKYSRHDENNLPYSMTGTRNKAINSAILNFPIVNLKNETTKLNDMNGWVLLDFWQFGCRPCFEQFKQFAQEKDSIGTTILEKEGVRILSIHPFSDNMEMIAEVGEKYHVTQYLYSAKGLKSEIEILSYPTYYLISPNKQIALKTNQLGDYSEILQIIKQYNNK